MIPSTPDNAEQSVNVAALVERLEKRAKEDESCAENSRVVAGLLAPEMAKFTARDDAGWNTYAVRLAADHQNSIKRDSGYAADLRAAIGLLTAAPTLPADVKGLDEAFPVATLDDLSDGAADVICERLRQKYGEGWTVEHDDTHVNGELAAAAANYALYHTPFGGDLPNHIWPWAAEWWKPTTSRRDLVKAGALIIAEIERLDRAAYRLHHEMVGDRG